MNRTVTRTWQFLLIAVFVLTGTHSSVNAQYFRFGKNKVHYQNHEWYFVQSKHFDVYYYEDEGKYLAEFTAHAAEDAYRQISKDFDHEISDRIAFMAYQSHNDFAVTNAVQLPEYSEGIGGVTELFKNRIAIPFTGDYRDYRRVVHHELVHAVINDMFYGGSIQSIIQNNIQLNIPLWFNEGLSEYDALGWDTNSDMYVRDAIVNNYLTPIPYLSGYFAYRGGQSVWDYISEQYGREKIAEIMQRLRLTRSVDQAFKRSIGLSLKELSERWQKALKKVHWPEMAVREDLEEIAKPIITREKGGFFNTSPAISPQGDKVAYISTKDGLFDLFVANANDGKRARKLIDGQDNTGFESLKILTPGISWSPDGKKIAIAVKSGESDAIAIIDVRSKDVEHFRVPGVDAIMSVAWNPKGGKIAFSASMNSQSDIYVLDMVSQETRNFTSDVFSDMEPSWSPSGEKLVFYSDRGPYTQLGRHTTENFSMIDYDYAQKDVYLMEPGNAKLRRLTYEERWDDKSPKFGAEEDKILFISDRNGIFNLYEKDLVSGIERPLTDVLIGITQVSVSADGNKAAVMSLREGTQSIYMLKSPFARKVDGGVLNPNIWAKRVLQDDIEDSPTLALAKQSSLQRNPYLRDASDGVQYKRTLFRNEVIGRESNPNGQDLAYADSTGSGEGPADAGIGVVLQDSSSTSRINFRDYVFSDAFEEAIDDVPDDVIDPFSLEDGVGEDGRLKKKKYKLTFSPDLVYGSAGYDPLYGGVQGVTQFLFSDVLGNHQIFATTNLLIDLRNSDYTIAYSYLPKRIDYTLSSFHMARILPFYSQANGGFSIEYLRYRNYGMGFSASLPIDKFRRFDAGLTWLNISQTSISNPTAASESRNVVYPTLSYTKDVTTPGFLSPSGGHRGAIQLSASPGGISNTLQFMTVLGDLRWYKSFGRNYSFAVRGSGAASIGSDQQIFYTSGVSTWINRKFDPQNGFPISDVADYVFATPVMPFRGSSINSHNGSYFGLLNAEFRFPLLAAVLPGPIPIFPLYNMQGAFFTDVGSIWGGRSTDEDFHLWQTDAGGVRRFDDLHVGIGVGLKTIMLGYPVRLDWAWPHDGQGFGDRVFYFSIGLDF